MSFFKRLFAIGHDPAPASRPHSQLTSGHSQSSTNGQPSTSAARRELLRVVLRETLHRHGIPAAWVGAETLSSTSRAGQHGIHWRLLLKHWDPRLMVHGVALQENLVKRLMVLDPTAPSWLIGVSWQYQLSDESLCPPMPHPGSWTADPRAPVAPADTQAMGGSGDVIAGPVRIAERAKSNSDDVRADLQHLFAVRDADYERHADAQTGHEKTQPMYLNTQPDRL